MNKASIVEEVRRTAKDNGGTPLCIDRFEAETGIKEWNWKKFWPRWNDLVREAGFTPNKLTSAYDEAELLEKYALLVQELGRLPAQSDLIFKANNNSSFPTEKSYRRFGGKAALVKKVAEFCNSSGKYEVAGKLCAAFVSSTSNSKEKSVVLPAQEGFVYLIKSGRFYKIGKTNSIGRREYELAIQLPEKAETIHVIQTDDPNGIEAYWHNRFAVKRKNGEWFSLSLEDISIFKRRKFM